MEIQAKLSSISDEVVETTMFYPAESVLEEQQQQQQQQSRNAEVGKMEQGEGKPD